MEPELAGEIRPGIRRPDWSVVTKPAVRAALLGRGRRRLGIFEKWTHGLEATQDLVWRTVLELFASTGRPPTLLEIGKALALPDEQVRAHIAELQARDLLAIDRSTVTISYAYPFTGSETEHRVELRGRKLHALCAIDALGIVGMFQADTTIRSRCRACGNSIEIATVHAGRSLGYAQPVDAVVWYDLAYGGSAAASCCPSIAFFCSEGHLQRWLTTQSPQPNGYCLALDEALEMGRALFEPLLATSTPS
jgi:hypothetical protein